MGIALISFGAVFLLVASAGLLLFYREAMIQRIGEVVNPRAKKADLLSSIQQTGSSLGGFVEQLNRVLPKSDAEVSVIQKRLIRAGFRKDSAVQIFYAAKILVRWHCALWPWLLDLPAIALSSHMPLRWPGLFAAGLLAGQSDQEAAEEDPDRPAGCTGFSGDLH